MADSALFSRPLALGSTATFSLFRRGRVSKFRWVCKRRREKAAAIAEFAASVVLLIPLFIILIYAAYETCLYLYLKNGVQVAARMQARWLAINFNSLAANSGNSAANYNTWINDKIVVANCVVKTEQFTNGTIDDTGTFTTTAPPLIGQPGAPTGQGSVAVKVVYPGSKTGLPGWPEPPISFFGVNLFPKTEIASISTYDIEP